MHAEDEKIALREIIRQLNTKLRFEDDQKANEDGNGEPEPKRESFSEKVKKLVQNLKSSNAKQLSVIFILEQFDLFASFPKRQTSK